MTILIDHLSPSMIGRFALRYFLFTLLLAIVLPLLFSDVFEGGIAMIGHAFVKDTPSYSTSFEMSNDPAHPLNARISIVNPLLLKSDGSGPVRNLDFDALGVFWSPVALMISLFLSSPCTWKKRSLGILVGILLMAPALYLYMRFLIWDESSYIELTAVSWKWREWVTDIRRILGIIMSCSLAVSIWFSIMLTQTKTAKSVKYV
jgi:hypothetical protein